MTKTITQEVDVDVDLDIFSNKELIEEMRDRGLPDPVEISHLKYYEQLHECVCSLHDVMELEMFIKRLQIKNGINDH